MNCSSRSLASVLEFRYQSLTLKYIEIGLLNAKRMAKMSYRVPNEILGTSRLSHVFLKIYPYDSTSKFQEYEIGSDLTLM